MHVVVVGCGRVGTELSQSLEMSGHTVAIIDKNQRAFRRLPSTFVGHKIVGLGFDRDDLIEAGVEGAGALAAVTLEERVVAVALADQLGSAFAVASTDDLARVAEEVPPRE